MDFSSDFSSANLQRAEDVAPRVQTVDSFIRLGASADTSEVRPLVSQVADFFKQIDIGSRDFTIEAPDVYDPSKLSQVGRTVRGQDVVRRTAVAIVDPAAYSTATGDTWREGTIGFFRPDITPGTKPHADMMAFLKTEGIAFDNPGEIDNFIFMSGPMAVRRGAENTVLDIGHEVTHAVFDMAGADEEAKLAQQALYREESTLRDLTKQIDNSSIPLGDKYGVVKHDIPEILELHKASARRVIAYAEEEVTAQTGALEFGRLAGLGTRIASDSTLGLTGYSRPDAFEGYVSRFSGSGFGPMENIMNRGYLLPEGSSKIKYTLEEVAKARQEWTYRMQDLGASVYSAGMQQADIPEGMYEAIDSMVLNAELAGSPGLVSSVKGFKGPGRNKSNEKSWSNCRWAKKSIAN
jgi:hypothetical protein